MAEADAKQAAVIDDDPCAGENFHPVMAWLCVAAALVFFLVGTGSLNMLNPILRMMLAEWGADTTMGSNWNSVLTIVCAVMSFPVAWAMNKWGYRIVGYISLFVLIGTAAWGAVCGDAVVMIVIRALQGIGYVGPGVISVYVVTQWFPKDKQQLPITIVALGPNLARIAMTQMSKPAIALGGWRMQWWFFLAVSVIALVLFIFFMRPGPGYAVAEAERRAKEEKKANQEKAPLATVLKNPYIWAVVLIWVFFTLGSRGFDTFTNMILTENVGISNDAASDFTSLYSLFKMVAAPICGIVLARFMGSRGKICAIMLTIFFLGQAFGFGLTEEWQAWVFVILVGATCCVAPFCFAVMPIFCESPAVLAMGLTFLNFLAKYIAGFVAPYIVSFIYESAGTFTAVMIPTLVMSLLGIACVWFVGIALDKKTKKEKLAEAAA